MRNTFTLRFILALSLLFASTAVMAQLPPEPPAGPESVPIDGGLSLLLAAGAALGGKKAWDARRKNSQL